MVLTERELQTVLAVFSGCLSLDYKKLNAFVGSLTIKDMQKLYGKLYYRSYCERHDIRFEDMTDEDFVQAYFEMNDI